MKFYFHFIPLITISIVLISLIGCISGPQKSIAFGTYKSNEVKANNFLNSLIIGLRWWRIENDINKKLKEYHFIQNGRKFKLCYSSKGDEKETVIEVSIRLSCGKLGFASIELKSKAESISKYYVAKGKFKIEKSCPLKGIRNIVIDYHLSIEHYKYQYFWPFRKFYENGGGDWDYSVRLYENGKIEAMVKTDDFPDKGFGINVKATRIPYHGEFQLD